MKQTLIKIADDHYVVVDDSEIKEGNWVVGCTRTVVQCMYPENVHHRDVEKITHSTQPIETFNWMSNSEKGYDTIKPLSLQEVKELIGEVDVEKNMWYERNVQNPYPSDSLLHTGFNKGFELGYNQAIEDKKDKKYTEEDIKSAIIFGYNKRTFDVEKIMNSQIDEEFIQSLQPKTEWEVTFDEQGKLRLV